MKPLLNIDVPDLAEAERFYTQAFGWIALRAIGDGVRELDAHGLRVYLLHNPGGSAAAGGAVRDYARHWTPLHADLVVDDVDIALVEACTAGAVQEGPIRTAGWGRIVRVADPFGHGWCLLQFLGRGYDEIASSRRRRDIAAGP